MLISLRMCNVDILNLHIYEKNSLQILRFIINLYMIKLYTIIKQATNLNKHLNLFCHFLFIADYCKKKNQIMSYLKVYYSNRRNDPIKHVREAAEVALKRMGGDHAAKCMQVTKVLASEMEFLKQPES